MSFSPTIPIPLPTDNTPTVRAYIQKVLSTSHNFSNESALHSAAEWKAGSGADLRKMRARRYRETFGNRVARILYQEVRVQVLEEEYAEREPLSRETREGWMAAIMTIESLVTLAYIFLFRLAIGFTIFVFWALGLCMVVHLARHTFFDQPSPLEAVENEVWREFGGM